MKNYSNTIKELKMFILLWLSQAFSGLGSLMTGTALGLWAYEQKGSALLSSLVMVSTYAPYVVLSIFAGAISDRWNKKWTMLICDTIAAMGSVTVFILYRTGNLYIWHIYLINIVLGLMNSVQQPASEVAVTRILPKRYYQKVGGMRAITGSINTIFAPMIASTVFALFGLDAVIGFDLFTFAVAFIILLCLIQIPVDEKGNDTEESLLYSAKVGLHYLDKNRGILHLILFLAAINFTASMYDASVLPMMLSRNGGSSTAYGIFKMVIGISSLLGSIVASISKEPKSRIRVICNTMLFSMGFENFMLAFGRSLPIWCVGGFLGWSVIPLMNTNLEAIMRIQIPVELQGRVFAVRNTLQFFTIPVGNLLGGFLIQKVFEPFMKRQNADCLLFTLFGSGKGSGAAFFFFLIAFLGIATCLYFRKDPHLWALEKPEQKS